jgi:hypothetical protein
MMFCSVIATSGLKLSGEIDLLVRLLRCGPKLALDEVEKLFLKLA